MDGTQFDHLIRSIGSDSTRRTIVRRVAAGLGALGRVAVEEAEAAPKQQAKRCVTLGKSCRRRRGKPKPKCCAGSVCKGNKCQCKPGRQKCGNQCIGKRQCCRNKDCPGNQRCKNSTNRCGCGNQQKMCNGSCIANAANCPVRVTPSNLHGWIPFGEDEEGPSEFTTFVTGPGSPPIGNGSVLLHPDAGEHAVIRTLKYAGQKIADITNLSYSIYVPAGGHQPTMQLAILDAPTGQVDGFASLVFVPGLHGNPDVPEATWSDQTPMDGNWGVSRDIFGPDDECLICKFTLGNTGSCAVDGACTGKIHVDWDTIVSAMPDAYLTGTDEGYGGFSLRRGGDTNQAGNVNNVLFNDDGYFFQPD